MTKENLVAIKHTNNTSKCRHCKQKIRLEDWWACCCHHRNPDGDLVQCNGNAEVRAHVHIGDKFWLIPSCKNCNRAWKSKMYVDRDYLFDLDCDCAFKKEQTPMPQKTHGRNDDEDSDSGDSFTNEFLNIALRIFSDDEN